MPTHSRSMSATNPPLSRRADAKAQRTQAILAAARTLFAERGFKGATTGAIARAAGITERTLFQYFPSKDALFAEVAGGVTAALSVEAGMARAAALMQHEPPDFATWYRQLLSTRLADVARNPDGLRLAIGQAMQDDAFRTAFGAEWMISVWQPALAAIRRYQASGELRADVPAERLARLILSVNLSHIITRHLLAPQARWDDAAEVEGLLDLVRSGAGQSGRSDVGPRARSADLTQRSRTPAKAKSD